MHDFTNSILIVVFNYSDCVCNKNLLKSIYGNHFKQIIFYSDYPVIQDDETNFVSISQGFFTHKIFEHFYENYKTVINDCDGIFYTMDDNIINVNILNLFTNDKIIYYYNQIKPLNEYSGWHWDHNNGKMGKVAINNLMIDPEFVPYNITKFSGGFSDWFYLPSKYLTDKLFKLFSLFAKHEVFLEIAIPSIINNIETDKNQYQSFTDEVMWSYEERQQLMDNIYIYKSLNHNHNFIVHPIKFNQNPASKT